MSSGERYAPWGLAFPDLDKWREDDHVWPRDLYRPKRCVSPLRHSPYNVHELNNARHTLLSSILVPSRGGRAINSRVGIPQIIPSHVFRHVFNGEPYPQLKDTYPQTEDRHPPLQDTYQQRQGTYPQRQGMYPQRQGMYPQPRQSFSETDFTRFDEEKDTRSRNFHSFGEKSKRSVVNEERSPRSPERSPRSPSPDLEEGELDEEETVTYRAFVMAGVSETVKQLRGEGRGQSTDGRGQSTSGRDHSTSGRDQSESDHSSGRDHSTDGHGQSTSGHDHNTGGRGHITSGQNQSTSGRGHITSGRNQSTSGRNRTKTVPSRDSATVEKGPLNASLDDVYEVVFVSTDESDVIVLDSEEEKSANRS